MGGIQNVVFLAWLVFYLLMFCIYVSLFMDNRVSLFNSKVDLATGVKIDIIFSLLLQVSGVEILSGGVIRLQVVEAEVNNISIRFLDRKT